MARRLLTVPALFSAWGASLVIALPAAMAAAILDVVRRSRGWPTPRLVAFAVAYLTYEVLGVAGATWLWCTRAVRPERWEERNRRLQLWWTASLIRAARPVLGLRLEVEHHGEPSAGPLVVASRHVSIVDSLLPAHVLGVRGGMRLRYVLTSGLRLDPCLDIVGHRLPNHFVDRGTADSGAEITALEHLAEDMVPGDAVVIFPEGGLFSPARRDRAEARLAERGSSRVEVARALQRLLPPRPAGTLALLRAAPTADVVVVGHRGFEPLASIVGLWRALPLADPVQLRVVHHPRASVPLDEISQVAWLDEQWLAMDRWLCAVADARVACAAQPTAA